MKKIIISCVMLFITMAFLYSQTKLDFNFNLGYSDNVFNLSDNDLDRFEDNQAYSYVESSDDLIQNVGLRLSHSFRTRNTRLTPSIATNYNNYLNNSDKSSFSMITGFNGRFKKLFYDLRYGYYPQNYTQKYKDSDGSLRYEKFEYEKNLFKLSLKYPVLKKMDIELYGKYEDYYHNKYFVEYDGYAQTIGIGAHYQLKPGTISGFYYFRQFINESDHSGMQTIIDNIKDCSFDSNIYDLKYQHKRIYTNYADYAPFLGFRFEQSFYQSDFSVISDPIHSTRKDNKIKVNIGSEIYFSKNLKFKLDVIKELRRVNSENVKLKDTKDYDKTQLNIGATWSFDFAN